MPKRTNRASQMTIIDLPMFRAHIPANVLSQHVPTFFHHLRESGNRIISPVECARPFFTNRLDEAIYEMAMSWIFAHVSEHSHQQCQFHRPRIPAHLDPFDQLRAWLEDAIRAGDQIEADKALQYVLRTFDAVSSLLRFEQYGYSPQIFEVYFETALRFVPSIQVFDHLGGEPTYLLLQAVCEASGGNDDAVARLILQFGLSQRQDLFDFCVGMAKSGEIFADGLIDLMLSMGI